MTEEQGMNSGFGYGDGSGYGFGDGSSDGYSDGYGWQEIQEHQPTANPKGK